MRPSLPLRRPISPLIAKQRRLYASQGLGFLGMASVNAPVGQGAGGGAATGATQGASYGAVAGPIGAAIGAVIGAVGGAIAGSINKRDPEQYNFDQAVAIWQQNPDAVYNIGNKYLPLAGLFDLNLDHACSGRWCIPMYVKYGHMGEERFTADFAKKIAAAGQSGQITAADTPITIMTKVVQPWIDSWGLGPLNDPHKDLINRLLLGMILDYVTGAAPQVWRARGGDIPASFASIPPFTLPQPIKPTATVPAPAPVPSFLPAGPVAPLIPSAPVPAPITLPSPVSPASPSANSAPPVPTTVPIPAGFQMVGSDTYSGLPIYAGPNGLYYSWNGTTMTPYSGSLMTSQGPLNLSNGLPMAPGPSALLAPVSSSTPTSPPPTTPAPAPATAGVSGSGLPSWLTWGAVGGLILLMLATAHPSPGKLAKSA